MQFFAENPAKKQKNLLTKEGKNDKMILSLKWINFFAQEEANYV